MPEFILDTTGVVDNVMLQGCVESGLTMQWSDLDAFTQGYIEALFFTAEGVDVPGYMTAEGDQDARPVGFSDLAPETLESIIADCQAFQRDASEALKVAYERSYDEAQAGRDFWFTRNGHGVGFWDREVLEPEGDEWQATRIPLDRWTPEIRATRERLKAESPGERLTIAAKAFGEVDSYLGDDGKVYL
jgi:hypothetical protein